MNMKHRNNTIKYSQQTQTDEEIIKDEMEKELKIKENIKSKNI